MFLINFQLWARNGKIPGGGNFNIRGDLIIVGSDYSSVDPMGKTVTKSLNSATKNDMQLHPM